MVAWGVPAVDAEHILRGAISLQELRPRETLYAQGAPVTHIYILHSGRLYQDRLTEEPGGKIRVSLRREVKPGQMIGQYDLLYGREYSTRVRALDFCNVISIEATALNRLLYQYPDLRHKIAPAAVIGRLRTLPFLEKLDPTSLSFLAEICEQRAVADGETIYSASDNAERLYMIDKGQVRLSRPNGDADWLGNGMALGFLDRIPDNPVLEMPVPYGHSAVAAGKVTLFYWPRNALVELTGIHPEETGHRLRAARERTIRNVTIFSEFKPLEQRKLIGYMSHYYFPVHHFVMQQGEVGDSLWILMPGSIGFLRALEGSRAMQPTRVHGPNFFGELSLRVEHPLESTVQAEPKSHWLRLHKEDFDAYVKDTDRTLGEKLTLTPAAERFLGAREERRRYGWLQQGENLLAFRRRHWIFLLRRLILPILLAAALLVVAGLFVSMGWAGWQLGVLSPLAFIVGGIFFWIIVDYLNDYILVTNQRVVHQEKVLFLTERRKTASLEQVRNVDVVTSFFGRMLGYGSINVQTAATDGSIVFDFLPGPHSLKQTVLEQQNYRVQHYQASTKMVIQNLLQERLGLQLRLPTRVVTPEEGEDGGHKGGWRSWVENLKRHLFRRREPDPNRIIWRKHWLVLLGKILAPLSIIIFLLMVATGQQFIPDRLHDLVTALDFAMLFVGAASVGWMLWNIADWRNDTYEVDYKELADVEKKPLFFAEKRRTALLSEIENTDFAIPSPIHYLFNFGNVRVQTAATQGNFTFDWVPNPRSVSEEIRRRSEIYRQRQEETRARQRAEELPDWFEMYDRMGFDVQSTGGNDVHR